MRTAVYIRVSTEDQAREGFSIPAQREKLLSYVHSQDWTLSKLYVDEGVSAKDTNRPALAELLQDVRSGKIDVVLVYRLDRLTRSVLDLYQLLQEFERYRVHFKSCTEVYDTTTAMGRLFITLVAALAQWERENLAERVKLGMEQMVKERKRPGGPPPYGYVLVDGALQLHPGEAGTVRTMFEQYLQGASPRRIAEQANSLGARGKNGAPWSASAVLRLLKNPVYYGALRWNHADSTQRQNPPEDWLLEESTHPAIIDEQTFLQVQQKIRDRSSLHPRVLASSFLYSGLLYCSHCGSPMRGKVTRSQTEAGNKNAHIYYVCSAKHDASCPAVALREDRVEKALLQQLMQYPKETREAAATVQSAESSSQQRVEAHKEKTLSQKRKRWEDAYENGLISLDVFRSKLHELTSQAMPPSPAKAEVESTVPDSAYKESFLTNWDMIWNFATREEKRQLITQLIARMEAQACSQIAHQRNREVILTNLQFR
ncbi:recombinase family protein [Brevibacillus nitrificans]|uniref:recombinase family protein n=1 Tax=Brevibacillus nitrificans TaxID=651560 RepID=UPI002E1D089F|nr:recombinase family protein [Brevibacillus nitrificans]